MATSLKQKTSIGHNRKNQVVDNITLSTKIEENFVCSEKCRAFFKEQIGASFTFNVPFQNWLKSNAGKTYKDAIDAYGQILKDKKKNKTIIGKQFEYNQYIRDFFEDNKGKTFKQATICWNYKKSLSGINKYEKSDLIALEKTQNNEKIMQKRFNINDISAILWGKICKKVFIAVHGNMSNKEDEVIKIFANIVTKKGYQVLSFDLPGHGERQNKNYPCKVQNCVSDLKQVINFAKENYSEINLWACSMGAYFSLLAYKDENIKNCLFLSPVINMKTIIDNMMIFSNVTVSNLKEKGEIKTNFGQALYYDYYEYVNNNPIIFWNKNTYILYGENDNLQSENIIKDFANKFSCNLSIMKNGDHYFHIDEQVDYYKNWLIKTIKNY